MQSLLLNMMTYKKLKVYLQTASLFACYDRLDLILDKKCRCIYCLSDRIWKSDLCFCSLRTYLHVASRLVFSFRLHNTVIRLFSHVTTSFVPEKPFQMAKIIFRSSKLIGRKSLSYENLLKDKRLKFTFLRESFFQVLVRGSSLPKKT